MQLSSRAEQAKVLRVVRKVHRTTGICLLVFFILVASTGLLLGWKKNSAGILLPSTQQGSSTELSTWLPASELQTLANKELKKHYPELSSDVARIDYRPSKGIAKFIYKEHPFGVQIDGATGAILQIAQRRSDLIEDIHDGTWFGDVLGIDSGIVKLLYTSIMGLALLVFCFSGFWLWYGPKRMRK